MRYALLVFALILSACTAKTPAPNDPFSISREVASEKLKSEWPHLRHESILHVALYKGNGIPNDFESDSQPRIDDLTAFTAGLMDDLAKKHNSSVVNQYHIRIYYNSRELWAPIPCLNFKSLLACVDAREKIKTHFELKGDLIVKEVLQAGAIAKYDLTPPVKSKLDVIKEKLDHLFFQK